MLKLFDDIETISALLEKYRKKHKLTKNKIAKELKISERCYSYKEKDPRKFTYKEILDLQDILGIEVVGKIFFSHSLYMMYNEKKGDK